MADILRQVRFGGIDTEEEVGDFWNRNRERRFSILNSWFFFRSRSNRLHRFSPSPPFQVRFGGIDIEEEGRKSEKGNRERAANRRRNYCGVIKSQCSHAKNGMWIRGFPRLYERLKWTRLCFSLEMEGSRNRGNRSGYPVRKYFSINVHRKVRGLSTQLAETLFPHFILYRIPSLTGFLACMATDDLEVKRQMDSSQGDRAKGLLSSCRPNCVST